jgi:hypothetical protein
LLTSVAREMPSRLAARVWLPLHSASAATMRARSSRSGALSPGVSAAGAAGAGAASARAGEPRRPSVSCSMRI